MNHTFETFETPTLLIDAIGGDLHVSGRPDNHVSIHAEDSGGGSSFARGNREDDSSDETIHLGAFGGDCRLLIPHGATIRLGAVGGDMHLQAVHGEIALSSIGGELKLQEVGPINLDSVGGDLRIKKIDGSLHAGRVGGDMSILDAAGSVYVERAGGDVALSNIQGQTIAATAGGDATLRLSLRPEQEVTIEAGGDIACFLPPDTSATVNLRSESRTVKLHGWEVPPPESDEVYSFTLGDGEAVLNLSARGDIALMAQHASGHEPFNAEFRARWEQDFGSEEGEPHLAFEFDHNFDKRFGHLSEEMAMRVQEKVQRAMMRAEQKIAEAMRRAEEKIARAEEKAAHMEERQRQRQGRGARRSWSPPPPPTPTPPTPPRSKEKTVGDEERMTVLRMVEEGKISVEQAEQLLAALRK